MLYVRHISATIPGVQGLFDIDVEAAKSASPPVHCALCGTVQRCPFEYVHCGPVEPGDSRPSMGGWRDAVSPELLERLTQDINE